MPEPLTQRNLVRIVREHAANVCQTMLGISIEIIGEPALAGEPRGTVVALIGLCGLAHFAYTRGIRLTVHQGGFVYGNAVVPFSRVRAIRYKLVHVMGGSNNYNRGFFHVRLDDGSKVSTSMQLAGASATSSLPIPNLPFLSGAHVYVQAATISPGANALGVLTSEGGDLLLGTL